MKRPDSKYEPGDSKREQRPNSPTPINLKDSPPPDDTGFLIIRLKRNAITRESSDLGIAARESELHELSDTLNAYNLTGKPLITSVTPERLRKLEERTANRRFAPGNSLLSYWRVDTRKTSKPLDEIEAALGQLPGVELVYREKTVSDPVTPSDDTYSHKETFLNKAPVGVNARWVWRQPHGDGSNMHFIDLEQGWFLDHEDLHLSTPPLIFNDNHDGIFGFVGNHGTAVLGIVAGVDNARGIIGIAPKVASVRVVSHWNQGTNESNVADALLAAVTADPIPHVLLIEAQFGADELPVETDPATFDAIGQAVAAGIVVVEAAGNGNNDLDNWTDGNGEHRLNRESSEFMDSGAILVGAATAAVPHERSIWPDGRGSNFGSRVDCYAWGDSIVSSGYGSLAGFGTTSYARNFGGTSGSASIIAGCALLLQGLQFGATNSLLSPEEIRAILSNPGTGTAQGQHEAGRIGVMPNLRAIVQANFS